MKIGIHNGSKVTEPDFSGKILFAQIWAKWPKRGFWSFYKSKPLCTFLPKMKELMVFYIILQKTIFHVSGCTFLPTLAVVFAFPLPVVFIFYGRKCEILLLECVPISGSCKDVYF